MSAPRRRAAAPWRRRLSVHTLPVLGGVVVTAAVLGAVWPTDNGPVAVTANQSLSSFAVPLAVPPSDDDIIAQALAQSPELDRSADREPLPDAEAAQDKVRSSLLALRDGVEIRADHVDSSPVLARVNQGDRVAVTGRTEAGWTEVIHRDLPRWILSSDLGVRLPLGTSPCASGSTVEYGLRPDTVRVHRAVCAEFPQISTYGGVRGAGEHATGQALDIMVSSAVGDQVAAFLQEHRAELGIEYLIWRQRIWRPATSNVWRFMSDRGGITANHYDHVHVTTYGNSATG